MISEKIVQLDLTLQAILHDRELRLRFAYQRLGIVGSSDVATLLVSQDRAAALAVLDNRHVTSAIEQ